MTRKLNRLQIAKHNHITRDIKPLGKCPACDAYHARRIPTIGLNETIHFQKNNNLDTHAAYDPVADKYTIVVDGIYTIVKFFKAGDVIDAPMLVTNKKP